MPHADSGRPAGDVACADVGVEFAQGRDAFGADLLMQSANIAEGVRGFGRRVLFVGLATDVGDKREDRIAACTRAD